ncbi:MAG: hypothetical protein J7527_06445 [Chitinophagaceae bacterium]|nr:hypothetical protein [Chitinophagaceae bacterium]
MSDQHLQQIIKDLQELSAEKAPYVGLHPIEEGKESLYIGANKEGLVLFATQLLQIAADSDHKTIDEHHAVASRMGWINQDSSKKVEYIKIEEPDSLQTIRRKALLANGFIGSGCLIALAVILASALIFIYIFFFVLSIPFGD